jgi:nucleotide-binding universal stress UspA family protein
VDIPLRVWCHLHIDGEKPGDSVGAMTEIKQITVGVDGSDSSRAALRWAYDEAAHHGASLKAVMIWHAPPLPQSPPYGSLPPEGYESQPARDAQALLERLTADLEARKPAVDVTTSIEAGNPAKVLIELSGGSDLMVVGSRGYGGFSGMLLGSVSQHLVAHSACPVVVVR